MKTTFLSSSKTVLAICFFILPLLSFAMGKPDSKTPKSLLREFEKKINYNPKNKNILKNAVVLLEISVGENGSVTIENFNSSKAEAAEYVIDKLKGIYLKETTADRFILKYSFK